jgi:REP element-mobilizing transposase RayT
MPQTLGYHYVRSAYGQWLPGDGRGHWSEAWDKQIGYIEPHMLHDGDPMRKRMAEERMKCPAVRWSAEMVGAIAKAIAECANSSPWTIVAASIEPTHLHIAISYSPLNIERTVKWIGQEMTKAVHRETSHVGPVFCKGRWLEFIFDEPHWRNVIRYIETHNVRRGVEARPYSWIGEADRG